MAVSKPLQDKTFSIRLEAWINNRSPNTIDRLNKVFAEKSIGIIIFLLMFLAATPLPTGGVSDIMAVIALFISFQLIIGRRTIALPQKWTRRTIKSLSSKRVITLLLRSIRWIERFTRPRMRGVVHNRFTLMLTGIFMFIYISAVVVLPPFSGLDSLPATGACLMALSLVFDDIVLLIAGAIVGAIGIGVTIGIGALLVTWLQQLLS
jgi:hypothetical protein